MAKVTITVCDNCSEQIPVTDKIFVVSVEGGDMTRPRQGELCDTCTKGLGLHGLPEKSKRKYQKKSTPAGHEVHGLSV